MTTRSQTSIPRSQFALLPVLVTSAFQCFISFTSIETEFQQIFCHFLSL